MNRIYRLILVAAFISGLGACGDGQLLGSEQNPSTTSSPSTVTTEPANGTTQQTWSATTIVSETTVVTSEQDPSTTTTTKVNPVTTSPPNSDYDPALQPLIDIAIADLAARLSVAPSAITVVSAEAVVWPDGALGCPQPGMVYTQVLVDGAEIVLTYDGVAYPYHSGGSRPPFLCEKG